MKKLLISTIFLLISICPAQAETLTWTASPMAASYTVYHRLSTSSDYDLGIKLGNVLAYQTATLSPGTHLFAVTTVTLAGKESQKSAEVFKVILPPPDPRLSLLTTLCKAFGGTAC